MTLRLKVRLVAISLLLVYTIIRFFIVRALLEGYGVNPWLFLLIDASTGVLYVIGIEKLILLAIRKDKKVFAWKSLLLWALVALGAFVAPYAYIYWASSELPPSLGIGIGVVVLLLLVNAGLAFVRRVRRARNE